MSTEDKIAELRHPSSPRHRRAEMTLDENRKYMGTAEEARQALISAARDWRQYRQPRIGSRSEHTKIDAKEREARFRLANATLLWLWHEENPL